MRDKILMYYTVVFFILVPTSLFFQMKSKQQKEEVYAYMCDNNASNISLDYVRFCVERKYKFERKQNGLGEDR